MGQRFVAECRVCQHHFEYNEGGGFMFHLLRCNKCGKEKSVGFNELGELHVRYLKGSSRPYSIVTAEADEAVRQLPSGPPITEEEYELGVEAFAGKCECKGKYKFKARPRCPKCRSTKLELLAGCFFYD